MTKKNYIALANALKAVSTTPTSAIKTIVLGSESPVEVDTTDINEAFRLGVRTSISAVATMLAEDNPLFDRQKFLNACGV